MKINRNRDLVIFSAVNLLFIISFKIIFDLRSLGVYSLSELKNIYHRHYETLYLLAQKTSFLFLLWLILFLLINGFFVVYYAKSYNKVREVILFSTVFILSFIGAEFILRKFNFKPGIHTYVRYFTPVDSLYSLDGFTTDSLGITKIDLKARQKVCENIIAKNSFYEKTQVHEVFCLARGTLELMYGTVDNNLAGMVRSLKEKDSSVLSELEKDIIRYVHCPINEDGFRSIPFKQYPSNKKKVLLIGDSFTWGHSTTNKFNSFADELLAKGYVVYNTGMTATDVAQYLAVAKEYIPVLKPDLVIVNFYLGNDITYYKREVLPYTPVFFYTNAGVLMSCTQGKYFKNKEDAYNLYLHQFQVPENDNIVNKLMAQTVITTMAWRVLVKLRLANYGVSDVAKYYKEIEKRKFMKPYCNEELKEIKKITDDNGATFILSSIPEVYSYTFNTKKDFPEVFEGLDYVEMNVNKSDYKLDDGHFNDAGHKRYADFLTQQIEARE